MPSNLFAEDPPDACPAYRNIRAGETEHAQEERAHCEDLWRDFEPFADEHFRSEFPVCFHQRWFEMYLTVALLRAGLQVACPKPGPDILLTTGNRRIWIEATCATAGELGRQDSVPDTACVAPGQKPVARKVPQDLIALRISSALQGKATAFSEYIRKGIVRPDDLCVIAINVRDIPHAWHDMDAYMQRALYGIGNLMVAISPTTHEVVEYRHESLDSIPKASSGAKVNVQPFIDGSLPRISAVIGSRENAGNRPAQLGGGFSLYPNLTPEPTWPCRILPLGQEWTSEPGEEGWTLKKISHSVVTP